MSDAQESRSLPRRRVYLGEGIRFELATHDAELAAEAVDMSAAGLGLAVLERATELPPVGARVTVCRPGARGAARVCHVSRVRDLPLLGLELAPDT
jgi:hypothetical protein